MPITKATASSIAPAAKGDLVVGSATNDAAVLGVGSNDTVLTADSSTATGLKWATPAASGMTLISTTTLSGTSVTLSSIPQTYKDLRLVIRNFLPSSDNGYIILRVNGDSNANRYNYLQFNGANGAYTFNQTSWPLVEGNDNATSQAISVVDLYDYTNTTTWKIGQTYRANNNATTSTSANIARESLFYNQTDAITSLVMPVNTGTITSGTALLYGVS